MKRTFLVIAIVAAGAAGAAWWLSVPARDGASPLVPAPEAPARPVALVVRLIDAVSGAPVEGGAVAVAGIDGAPERELGSCRWHDSGLRRGEWASLDVAVTDVPGHADARHCGNALVGTFTDVAELTILLQPTIDLVVDVRDGAGNPVEDARLTGGRVGDAYFGWPFAASGSDGRLVVHRVPFVAGARVRVGVERGGERGQGETTFGSAPRSGAVVPVRIGPGQIDIGLLEDYGGGTGGGPRTEIDYAEPQGDASVLVTLLTADGAAHAGVALSLCGFDPAHGWWRIDGLTDPAGRVAFRGAPAGRCVLRAWGRGLGPEDREFDAVAGATTTRTIRESAGLTSVVTVLDEERRPVAGASVDAWADPGAWDALDSCLIVQEEDGTQRLAPRTGSDGRVRLSGLPAGRLGLCVKRILRSVSAELVAGEDVTVTLASGTR